MKSDKEIPLAVGGLRLKVGGARRRAKDDGRWVTEDRGQKSEVGKKEAKKVDRKKMGSREVVKMRKGQEDGRSKDKGEREKAKFDCDCVI